MLSLVRYTCARCFSSQRWLPPILIYLLGISLLFPPGASLMGSGALGAVLLIPISSWLAVTAINSEDLSQQTVTSTNAGGHSRSRLGSSIAAFCVSSALGFFSILMAVLRDTEAMGAEKILQLLFLLVSANTLTSLFGSGIGAVVARPIVARVGFTWLTLTAIFIASLAVPLSPFARLIQLLNAPRMEGVWSELLRISVETAAISTLLVLASLALSRRMM